MLLEAVDQSLPCLTHVGGWAITARDPVHHTGLLLWWDRIFHIGQDVLQCGLWLEAGSDA